MNCFDQDPENVLDQVPENVLDQEPEDCFDQRTREHYIIVRWFLVYSIVRWDYGLPMFAGSWSINLFVGQREEMIRELARSITEVSSEAR